MERLAIQPLRSGKMCCSFWSNVYTCQTNFQPTGTSFLPRFLYLKNKMIAAKRPPTTNISLMIPHLFPTYFLYFSCQIGGRIRSNSMQILWRYSKPLCSCRFPCQALDVPVLLHPQPLSSSLPRHLRSGCPRRTFPSMQYH